MVSCAFATAGMMEIATVKQINPLLILIVLHPGLPASRIRLIADQRK
jgi:hypothetical protein